MKAEKDVTAAGYDGIVFVSNKGAKSKLHPQSIQDALLRALRVTVYYCLNLSLDFK